MRAMLKAWSNGGIAAADAVMLDLTRDLFSSADVTKWILRDGQSDRGKR
jgi:hypothetical protein